MDCLNTKIGSRGGSQVLAKVDQTVLNKNKKKNRNKKCKKKNKKKERKRKQSQNIYKYIKRIFFFF